VGVALLLGTLESSFWMYNGYLKVQRYQQDKQREAEEAAVEAADADK